MIIAFAILAGVGIFATLCSTAPVWDEDRQRPAEDAPVSVERA